MALFDDKARIRASLLGIPGVKRVLPAWPRDWQQLPAIVLTEAANSPAEHRDDRAYLTRLEYYVRVFADRTAELAEIASAVDDAMTALGYARTLAWEDDSAEARQKVLRYRIYVG